MKKIYKVRLTLDERAYLQKLIKTGKLILSNLS